jgi:hypothetical protein
VAIGVQRQHRAVVPHLPGFLVDPGIPEPGQASGRTISTPKTPPDVLARLPAWFIEAGAGMMQRLPRAQASLLWAIRVKSPSTRRRSRRRLSSTTSLMTAALLQRRGSWIIPVGGR